MSELLDGARVARRLGLSKPTIYKMWDAGELPCTRFKTSNPRKHIRRIDSDALELWIKSKTTTSEVSQ